MTNDKGPPATKTISRGPLRASLFLLVLICTTTVTVLWRNNPFISGGTIYSPGAATTVVSPDDKASGGFSPGTLPGPVPADTATIQRLSDSPSTALGVSLPEPTAYARQLVADLTGLGQQRSPLTAERAAEWKTNLQQLV